MTLRQALRDLFAPTPSRQDPIAAAAEARWLDRNEATRAAGCRCGNPSSEVRYDSRNVGSVAVEFWTCAEHVGVESWTGVEDDDGKMVWTPSWGHDRPIDGLPSSGHSGPIGGPPNRWYYPVKPDAEGATP